MERTTDLFEKIEGYPEPQKLPLEAFDYSKEIDQLNSIQKFLLKVFLRLTNFQKFHKNLPQNFELLARTLNVKSGGLWGPVVSASISLKDDRNIVNPLNRAASVILAVRSIYSDLKSAKFSVDEYKGQPLEMGEYPNIFATTQVIGKNIVKLYKSNSDSQITIIVNGHYYIMKLDNLKGTNDLSQITDTLESIIHDSKEYANDKSYNSPGVLTAANKKFQLKRFNKLSRVKENYVALETLKHSLFVLCLDLETEPIDYGEVAKFTHSKNYHNRWFHSSLQIIIYGNAKIGVILNFSNYISGNNMMRVGAEIKKQSSLIYEVEKNKNGPSKLLEYSKLNWKIDAKSVKMANNLCDKIKDNQQATFVIQSIGKKDFIDREKKIIPIFTIALQMTIHSYVRKPVNIRQFLSMSKYRCLDLVTANVTTNQTLEFVNQFNNTNRNRKIARELLDSAIKSQVLLMREQRKYYPLYNQLSYFLKSSKGIKEFYLNILSLITILLLNFLGGLKYWNSEVLISHPNLFTEVPVIGRPGIKLPYVKYFGLHYLIWKEKIVITMMPGIKWKIKNEEFISTLEDNLKKIRDLLLNDDNND